ncbi:protein of unknown function [Azospirillum baldaniorum]|uniref:Uncharacterized protein n=1 Tax=Azospirillum baldaniorum TaxID=1064539 RepID=A0A9P1NN44_9PROT|nr:protein of unknown function [Azospirillum baldaniorum]
MLLGSTEAVRGALSTLDTITPWMRESSACSTGCRSFTTFIAIAFMGHLLACSPLSKPDANSDRLPPMGRMPWRILDSAAFPCGRRGAVRRNGEFPSAKCRGIPKATFANCEANSATSHSEVINVPPVLPFLPRLALPEGFAVRSPCHD